MAESAKRALTGILAHWDLHEVMACDDVGETRLETVTIAFPSAEEPRLARGDDPFLLEESGDELTVRAAEGRLGRLDRRDALVERVLAALASPGRSSVMLVGPRDVGKTALLHELASRLAAGDVPPALRGRELWRITANELIAGATYTGMWQDRARIIVARGRAEGAIFAMGDPVGDPRRGPLERERQQPVALLEAVRRERRGQPDLRVRLPSSSQPSTRGSRASSTRSTASTSPSRAARTRARS